MGKRISNAVSRQTKGGSQFAPDDVDVEIISAKYDYFEYDESGKPESEKLGKQPCLLLGLKMESDGSELVLEYKAGDPKRVKPSDDGEFLEPVDDEKEFKGLNEKSKAGTFLNHAVQAGLPDFDVEIPGQPFETEDGQPIGRPISTLVGIKGHLVAIEYKTGGGFNKTQSAKKKDFPDQVSVFNKITSYPGMNGAGKTVAKPATAGKVATPAATAAPAATPAAAQGGEMVDDLRSALLEALMDDTVTKPISKARVSTIVNKAFADRAQAEKMKLVQTAMTDSFLKSGADEGLWSFADRQINVAS